MTQIPTMNVIRKIDGKEIIINESDFDENKHKKPTAKAEKSTTKTSKKPTAKAE